ncbi:MAG: hypothetical protein AAF357_09665, partial [Verrucomicrobiota bacterium]
SSDPSLEDSKVTYLQSVAEAKRPVLEFQQRYVEELDNLAKQAQLAGQLEEMLAIKEEIEGFKSGPGSNLAGYPAAAKLRGIYDSNLGPLEATAKEKISAALKQHIAEVSGLVSSLTSAGNIDEAMAANKVKQSLVVELASLESVDSTSVNETSTTTASASEFVADVQTVPALRGKAGRLRAFGNMRFGGKVLPEELQEIDDFVRVYAYHTGWIGIRGDGKAVTTYIKQKDLSIQIFEERSPQIISRGHDGWIVNRRNEFWRAVEPERATIDLKSEPAGILGCHCAGLAYWFDGEAVVWGSQFAPDKKIPPPEGFFRDVIGAGSGNSTMIAIDEGGTLRGWDIVAGEPVTFEGISNVVELESGKGHAIVRKSDGELVTFPTRPDLEDWDRNSMSVPIDFGGVAARIRAGGQTSAIQRTDGTWFAWGPSNSLNETINSIGVAIDLDVFSSNSESYAIWIEPVE